MRHWENKRSLVCGSVMVMVIVSMHSWMIVSCWLKYSRAKEGEPTGDPRRRNPVVSSSDRGGPVVSMLFGFVD
jgi:hypothetical protein